MGLFFKSNKTSFGKKSCRGFPSSHYTQVPLEKKGSPALHQTPDSLYYYICVSTHLESSIYIQMVRPGYWWILM